MPGRSERYAGGLAGQAPFFTSMIPLLSMAISLALLPPSRGLGMALVWESWVAKWLTCIGGGYTPSSARGTSIPARMHMYRRSTREVHARWYICDSFGAYGLLVYS